MHVFIRNLEGKIKLMDNHRAKDSGGKNARKEERETERERESTVVGKTVALICKSL